jgi:hypothetical protein
VLYATFWKLALLVVVVKPDPFHKSILPPPPALKCWYPSTNPHDMTTHKKTTTDIFTAVRASNLKPDPIYSQWNILNTVLTVHNLLKCMCACTHKHTQAHVHDHL